MPKPPAAPTWPAFELFHHIFSSRSHFFLDSVIKKISSLHRFFTFLWHTKAIETSHIGKDLMLCIPMMITTNRTTRRATTIQEGQLPVEQPTAAGAVGRQHLPFVWFSAAGRLQQLFLRARAPQRAKKEDSHQNFVRCFGLSDDFGGLRRRFCRIGQ